MRKRSILRGILLGVSASMLAASASLADTPAPLAAGQSLDVSLGAGSNGCDTAQLFTLSYPGDNSSVTIDARFSGLDPVAATNVGFNVWDGSNHVSPVEAAPLANSLKNGVANVMEFNYASGLAGTVTFELYNWARVPVSGSVTLVASPSNGAMLQPLGDKPAGAC